MSSLNNREETTITRFLTWELLCAVVLVAVSWGSNAAKVTGLEEDIVDNGVHYDSEIDALEVEQKKQGVSINEANRKLDVIENEMGHIQRQQDRVLEILEREYVK